MSEKKEYKLLEGIRYSFLEWISLIMLVIFTINPCVKVLLQILFQKNASDFRFMHEYNRNVLLIGGFVFLIYFVKLRIDGKLPHIKDVAKKHIAVILFLIFAALMMLTTFLNGVPKIAIEGYYYRGEGIKGFLSYIIYFLLASFLLSEKKKRILVSSFLITSLFVGCVIFVDYMFLNEKYNYAMKEDMILSNSNHLGYYLLMSIMFYGMMFIGEKRKILKGAYLCGFAFVIIVLIMNDTWGCQLALLVGIIFTIIVCSIGNERFQLKPLVLLMVMVLTFVGAYFADDRLKGKIETNITQQIYDIDVLLDENDTNHGSAGTGRVRLWENAIKYLLERPIIGHGADVTGSKLMRAAGSDRCHCEFLNYAVSFGIPATLVYIAAIFMVYLRGLKKKVHLTEMNYVGLCVAFTYLASSLVGNSMYYTAPFLFIALGMGYVRERKEN